MATGDLIIPEGYGNAVFQWQFTGRTNPITCGLGFSPDSGTDAGDMANDLFNIVTGSNCPCEADNMNVSYTFTGVKVTYNDGGTIIGGESTHAAVVGSMSGTSPMIISSAVLIRKTTGLVGKKFNGRFYWPKSYGTESGVDALGNIDSSEVTAIQAQWTNVATALDSHTPAYVPNVLHHQPSTGTAPVPTPIGRFSVQSKTATQRRRIR